MKDIRYVIDRLEEELANFEMAVEQNFYVSKSDEVRYRMAQELLAWILEYKFDPKYSVSRVPCDEKSEGRC